MVFSYNPKGVCSKKINIETDDETNKIVSVSFVGGCSGNTQGICSLVKGMDVDEVIERLENIKCGFKSSSCPAQLAEALKSIKK